MAAGGTIVVTRDARGCEAELVRRLRRLHAATRREPARLARPIRVVVPSRALREHLSLAIVRDVAPAVLGVGVQTVRVVAQQILERAGRPTPRGGSLLELVVRREAARHPALRPLVEEVDGGAGLLTASVRDLLDAGLAERDGPPLPRPPGPATVAERAAAIAAVAARVPAALAEVGAARDEDALADAARVLSEHGAGLLPTRALLVVGFADATGTTSRLLGTLLATLGGTVLVEHPDDPAAPGTEDAGTRFTSRFLAGLRARGPARVRRRARPHRPPARPRTLTAPGPDAELAEVAGRVHALLEAGTRPEAIGVVARTLDEVLVPARRHFAAYGIPWSGARAPADLFDGPRRAGALVALLEEGADASLATLWTAKGPPLDHDLRVGLAAAGARRLGDVARLDVDVVLEGRERLRLPVGLGLRPVGDDEDGHEPVGARVPSRTLSRERLERARDRIAALLEARAGWPARAPLARHLDHLEAFVTRRLRARPLPPAPRLEADDPARGWSAWLAALRAETPGDVVLERDEALSWLRSRGARVGVGPAGGRGRGVRVLDVTHARGLAFEHLFVVGTNRHALPRVVREDPLLPDRVREAWRAELPALPVKLEGRDEERYLFAALLASAEHVTVSWQSSDDDGRVRLPSPYLDRMRLLADDWPEPVALPRARPARLDAHPEGRPRPPGDALLWAGLRGTRADVHAVLPLALAASWARFSRQARAALPAPARAAAVRARLLDEVDPDPATEAGRRAWHAPGPWSGDVGPLDGRPDPRRAVPWVTALERLAACPWQGLLTRLLRVEAPVDTHVPWRDLDRRLLGIAVHDVLDELVEEAVGAGEDRDLRVRLEGDPVRMPRPDGARVRDVARDVARRLARREGLRGAAFAQALAALAETFVVTALDTDWPGRAVVRTFGAELEGRLALEVGGVPREVAFRADRVDLAQQRVRLVDYKTGATQPKSHDLLARGRALQAATYARAVAGGHGAVGRLLYLREEAGSGRARHDVASDDATAAALLEGALAVLLEVWDRGLFVPRFEEPDGGINDACRLCDVREACVRDDSTARRRLRRAAVDRPGSTWERIAALAARKAGDVEVDAR